jgi:FkbM family methyltransferase
MQEQIVPDRTDVTISVPGEVVRCVIWGQPIYFTITNRRDVIQKKHLRGEFYEPQELEIIRRHFKPGGVFCDIGTNIGNHTLFALKFLYASQAILVEPNPAAIAILLSNLQLNGVEDRCDLSHLGFGLSDRVEKGLAMVAHDNNLGGGRMVAGEGALQTRRGDDLLGSTHVDFIKIDVEGMELQALRGLSGVIAACRPVMFVEVDNVNATAFGDWVNENGYAVRTNHKRYRMNENYLIGPRPVRPRAVSE